MKRMFFFRPLRFGEFLEAFASKYDLDSDTSYRLYKEWLARFQIHSLRFYQSQYVEYKAYLLDLFMKVRGLPLGDPPSEYGFEEEWRDFAVSHGLPLSFREIEERVKFECGEPRSKFSSVPLKEVLRRMEEHLDSDGLHLSPVSKPSLWEVNELWFNTIIDPSKEETEFLRELPYERYLQTEHWGRVRAAVLLIRGAVCQAESHYSMGDSWYGGWESDLNVHHLHYHNLGRERYKDLILLCQYHHSLWHREVDAYGEPRMSIITEDLF